MMATAQPNRLDYRDSERFACVHFGVDAVIGQDGLVEISERATPGDWARYYINHAHSHDAIFIASAIDAMLTELIRTEDRTDLDEIRRALNIAQQEPWSCVCIGYHTEEYGDSPGEQFVLDLVRNTVDSVLVQRNAAGLCRPPDSGAAP